MSDSQSVPTVAVVHPEGEARGFVVINASDFDPAVHTKWEEPLEDAPEASAAAKPSAAPPKRGSKS
jgi:hypothetical protein